MQTSNGDEVVTSEERNFTVGMLSCVLLACQNNGRCAVDEATGDPFCVCPKGFSGEQCENSEGDGDVGLVVGNVVPASVVLAVVLVTALLMKMRKKDTDKVELKEVSVGHMFTSKDWALVQFNTSSNGNQKRIEDFFDQLKDDTKQRSPQDDSTLSIYSTQALKRCRF